MGNRGPVKWIDFLASTTPESSPLQRRIRDAVAKVEPRFKLSEADLTDIYNRTLFGIASRVADRAKWTGNQKKDFKKAFNRFADLIETLPEEIKIQVQMPSDYEKRLYTVAADLGLVSINMNGRGRPTEHLGRWYFDEVMSLFTVTYNTRPRPTREGPAHRFLNDISDAMASWTENTDYSTAIKATLLQTWEIGDHKFERWFQARQHKTDWMKEYDEYMPVVS